MDSGLRQACAVPACELYPKAVPIVCCYGANGMSDEAWLLWHQKLSRRCSKLSSPHIEHDANANQLLSADLVTADPEIFEILQKVRFLIPSSALGRCSCGLTICGK